MSEQPGEVKTMNLLTDHPRQQGITYIEHWNFAMGIAWRLLNSVFAFALHAVLPFISIEPHLDLEATATFLEERNQFIETARNTVHGNAGMDVALLTGRAEFEDHL
jgi:hypothetical protein